MSALPSPFRSPKLGAYPLIVELAPATWRNDPSPLPNQSACIPLIAGGDVDRSIQMRSGTPSPLKSRPERNGAAHLVAQAGVMLIELTVPSALVARSSDWDCWG